MSAAGSSFVTDLLRSQNNGMENNGKGPVEPSLSLKSH